MNQINPFQQNYDVGNTARNRSAMMAELRQRAIQAQTEQNTQLDTNRVDLMKSVLSNMLNLRDTFGSVDTGGMLGQFGIQVPQGLGAPDTYSALRDDLDLQGLKQGVLSKMTDQLKSGYMIGPDGQLTQVATPGERIAQTNNAGALQRTQITQQGMDRRAKSGGGNSKTMYEEVSEEVRDPKTGKVTTRTRYVPIEADPNAAPTVEEGGMIENPADMIDQNQPAGDPAEQQALQEFDELTAMRGFDKVSPGVKQADGSYLFEIARRGDTSGQTLTYRVAPGALPQRVR